MGDLHPIVSTYKSDNAKSLGTGKNFKYCIVTQHFDITIKKQDYLVNSEMTRQELYQSVKFYETVIRLAYRLMRSNYVIALHAWR